MKDKFIALYIILGLMAFILILTGITFDLLLQTFHITLNKSFVKIMQIAFVVSGIADFALMIYAKRKL